MQKGKIKNVQNQGGKVFCSETYESELVSEFIKNAEYVFFHTKYEKAHIFLLQKKRAGAIMSQSVEYLYKKIKVPENQNFAIL